MKRSERAQEVKQVLLLAGTEVVEILFHIEGFRAAACMVLDGVQQVGSAPVVHQEDSLSKAPQGSRAELVAARSALRDIVRKGRAHVMDLEVGVCLHGCLAQ